MLYFLRDILIPLVIAFVLAVLVEALVVAIGRRWPGAPSWLVSWIAGIVVILAAAGGIFVLAQGAVQTVAQAPALQDRLDALIRSVGASLHILRPLDLKTLVGQVNGSQVAGYVLSGVQDVGGTVILVTIYFGFMLGGRRRISRKFDVIAGSSASWPNRLIERAAADIRTYLWVQTVTGAMITAAATAVMLAVGLNNVLFWTVIFFLLTFIPNIGVTVGSVAPALFALLQFPTKWQAIVIFAVVQVAAFVVGNVIYPRMQAETQNIDPIATILALSFWTFLWGITGAFLAVPLTLMLMMIFSQFDNTRWISATLSNDGKPDFRKSI
ncbi:MAG: transport protein TqsA [Sphingomonadales bacterium]|nr:transport protein TqsA [Sphingomonadales bacterium]